MRIRKRAARILSSLSIPAQSCAAAPAGGEVTTDGQLQLHVCELNQSPWDVMAFSPSDSLPSYRYQEVEVEEEYEFTWGATWTGQGDEGTATAASDVSGIGTRESTLRRQVKADDIAEGAEHDEKRERKVDPKKRGTNNNTKRTKRKSTSFRAMEGAEEDMVTMEVESATTAVVSSACKKTDGKGWCCKRKARHPHSFCEYHFTQVRSYYSNSDSTTHVSRQQLLLKIDREEIDANRDAALIPDKKNSIKKKTTEKKGRASGNNGKSSNDASGSRRKKQSSDFFFYYSGFGPWRGKRRGVGGDRDGGDRGTGNVDVATDGHDDGDGPCDSAPIQRVHDQAPEDLDDDDDADDVGNYDGDDVLPSRRGRKPVKARSLKSLLW